MTTSPASETLINMDVQRLLTQYDCPMKLHEVRAAFMGAIASPFVVDPSFELHALWDGAFPELDSDAAAHEIQEIFLTQLWGALARHTDQEEPFKLTTFNAATTLNALIEQARVRGEELDAFMDCFFQDQEDFELDPDAAESLNILEELIAMYAEIINMPAETTHSSAELKDLIQNTQKMHEMAEAEINNMIMLCA